MGKSTAEVILERGLEQGLEQGRLEGHLQALREWLIDRLTRRFGKPSAALLKRIQANSNSAALRSALQAVETAKSPRDVKL